MASEIRVDKINSLSGVGTVTLSPTGVDISGITTVQTLKVGTGVTLSADGDGFFTGVITATSYSGIDLSDVTGATGDFSIADKIVHTGDTNTAIRFPSADNISFEVAGTERLRIDDSDGVIAKHTTAANLRVQNSTAASSQVAQLDLAPANGLSGVQLKATSEEDFSTGANRTAFFTIENRKDGTFYERLRIDSSGRLGIGTESGTRGLNVEGTGNASRAFFNDSSNHKAVEFGADSTGSFQSTIGDNPHLIYTDGTERARFTSSGLKLPSGNGIDFSSTGNAGNSASMSSELFDDYEEGTWVPTSRDGTLSYSNASYTKIGRMVHVTAYLYNFSDNSTNDSVSIQGIPFSQSVGDTAVGSVMYQQVSDANRTVVFINNARSAFLFYGGDTGGYDQVRYNELSGSSTFYLQATYFAS